MANYGNRFSRTEADLLILKWMVGFVLAGTVPLLFTAFT
jgi:hypothetical protein|tara:strand:- start:331 stop:447 length:117 start_codon:yes stop_codon:yes gene_type:complete